MIAQRKIQLIHGVALVTAVVTLTYNYSLPLLLSGIALGWLLWFFGVSISLHKWYSHGCFTPKNKFIQLALLYLGTIACLESHISWKVGHKIHHKYSGQDYDPFSGKGFFGKLRVATYNHNMVTDKEIKVKFRKAPDIVWFHRNYFNVIAVTFLTLLIIFKHNVGYFTAIPILYVLSGYGWIVTLAHCRWAGRVNYELGDDSSDNLIWQFIYPGEGNHNTHHKFPGKYDNGDYDFTAPIIDRIKAC